MMGTSESVLSDTPAECPWLLTAGDVVERRSKASEERIRRQAVRIGIRCKQIGGSAG